MGTNLGNQYALHALKQRRALLAGEIIDLERRLRRVREMAKHLDATMAFMAPDFDPSKVRPARPRKAVHLFASGKLSTLILDALRRGAKPMTVGEIAVLVTAAAGFPSDAEASMKPRVRSVLFYLWKGRGLVAKDGDREKALWRLS